MSLKQALQVEEGKGGTEERSENQKETQSERKDKGDYMEDVLHPVASRSARQRKGRHVRIHSNSKEVQSQKDVRGMKAIKEGKVLTLLLERTLICN